MLRSFFKRTGQPLMQPWLVALVGGLVRRLPVAFLMRLGWGTVFRPRTRGWGKAGRAIEDYVQERRGRAAARRCGWTAREPPMDGKIIKRVAYYPGCALEGTGHAYNRSTKAVGKELGLELVEVKDWNCCGAMEVKNIDPKIQTYLSARNLSIAEDMGFDTVMAPCNGCYHNLKKAEYDLAHDRGSPRSMTGLSEGRPQDLRAGQGRDHPRARLDQGRDRRGGAARARQGSSLKGSRSPTTTAACTRARATSSPKRTRARDRNRR